eukprot:15451514-Alexandrium_andersonii.AAC.1
MAQLSSRARATEHEAFDKTDPTARPSEATTSAPHWTSRQRVVDWAAEKTDGGCALLGVGGGASKPRLAPTAVQTNGAGAWAPAGGEVIKK